MKKQRDTKKLNPKINKQVKNLSNYHLEETLKDLLRIMKSEFQKNPDAKILVELAYQYEMINKEKEKRNLSNTTTNVED